MQRATLRFPVAPIPRNRAAYARNVRCPGLTGELRGGAVFTYARASRPLRCRDRGRYAPADGAVSRPSDCPARLPDRLPPFPHGSRYPARTGFPMSLDPGRTCDSMAPYQGAPATGSPVVLQERYSRKGIEEKMKLERITAMCAAVAAAVTAALWLHSPAPGRQPHLRRRRTPEEGPGRSRRPEPVTRTQCRV